MNPELPVVVIGAGPLGLAAAAHLLENGLTPLVLEAGESVGAAITAWGHIKLFSPWQYNVDPASARLLTAAGWESPRGTSLPTGRSLVQDYLMPLAATPQLAPTLRLGHTVTAVSRLGMDKTRSANREQAPFLVRVRRSNGDSEDLLARAVIDASGTWGRPNPLGQAGLPAPGESDAAAAITGPLPDVLGTDRERFAGKHVVVVGAGHSAANTLLALGDLAREHPHTSITWLVRGASVTGLYGGGDLDGLPARGMLGTRLRKLVEAGTVALHTSFTITGFTTGATLGIQGLTPAGEQRIWADVVIPATGFRPDLDMLAELRLDLDPAVEAPRALGPLIDPEFHSCGTVPAHGAAVLSHPEKDFYLVGMKSYGRAPTFLMATGYEQVRSIAAALAGNHEAATRLELDLPETGVCSAGVGSSCEEPVPAGEASCCAEPVLLGIPTGLAHAKSGRLPLIQQP